MPNAEWCAACSVAVHAVAALNALAIGMMVRAKWGFRMKMLSKVALVSSEMKGFLSGHQDATCKDRHLLEM